MEIKMVDVQPTRVTSIEDIVAATGVLPGRYEDSVAPWFLPRDCPSVEQISDWIAEHVPELPPVSEFQRDIIDRIQVSMPAPPSADEIMGNMRRFMRMLDEQPRFIANPQTAQRARMAGHDLNIIASDLVQEGQVYVYNPPRLEDVSLEQAPMRWAEDRYAFQARARFAYEYGTQFASAGNAFRLLADSFKSVGQAVRDFLTACKGAGRTAPRNNPRVTALHKAYRARQISRRRRNR